MHSTTGTCERQATAVVLPFRGRSTRRPAASRLGMRERIAAESWAQAARARGIARAVFHAGHNDDDPADGDFILVYEAGADWASWGVAPQAGGYAAWRAGNGMTIGCFASLVDALDALLRAD